MRRYARPRPRRWFLLCLAWAVTTGPSEKNVRATLMALINSLCDRQPSVRIAATRALWMVVLVAHVPRGND